MPELKVKLKFINQIETIIKITFDIYGIIIVY